MGFYLANIGDKIVFMRNIYKGVIQCKILIKDN